MLILAIETSCDETGLALVEASGNLSGRPKFKILKEEVASQIAVHRPFGGVVPMLAKREHQKNLPVLYAKLFGQTPAAEKKLWAKIDLIAVTVGPGLEPALWQGVEFAQALGKTHRKPVLGVNHLEGHLYSFLLPGSSLRAGKKFLPAIALIVSGGHTILLSLKDLKTWRRLGETRDDAVGEAFDKVARLLNLPYPGGPEIEKLAKSLPANWTDHVNFPRPMANTKDYDFSFSGLKTSVLYYLRDHPFDKLRAGKARAEVARAFSNAAIDVLVKKTLRAAKETGAKSLMLSGGVAANKSLRAALKKEAKKSCLPLLVAPAKYNTDNAVMIAAAAYLQSLRKKKYPLRARGDLSI